MSTRNRNIWIIVAVVVVVLCCCAAMTAAAIAWGLGFLPYTITTGVDIGGVAMASQRVEKSFPTGEEGVLQVDSFAGSITVSGDSGDEMRVVATKHARQQADLDRIDVQMERSGSRLVIETSNPRLLRNAWVELEITVPRATRADLHTGSGSIDVSSLRDDVKLDTASGSVEVADVVGDVNVRSASGSLDIETVSGDVEAWTASGRITLRDVEGTVDAHSNSGAVEARQASGQIELDTSSGSVRYQGQPEGDCRFSTNSGSIVLELPADLDATLDLTTSSGSITHDFSSVVGTVTRTKVDGYVGDGKGCQITARTPSGGIDVRTR